MPLCGSHGPLRSFGSITLRLLPRSRPMRPLHARGAAGRGLLGPCCRHRFLSSSWASRSPTPRRPLSHTSLRMSARKTTQQVWHVSRGIVFAGGSSVVYPRLPLQRHYSTPAAVDSAAETGATLPTVLSTATAPSNLPVRPPAGNAQTSTPATAPTAITALTAAAGAAKGDQAVMANTAEPKPEEDSKKTDEESEPKDTGPILPPFTPLDFKMPAEAFQKAKKAAEGTPQSYWSYDMYRRPGIDGADDAKVKVHYCTSSATTERVIKEYFKDEKILGFDLEWMANATKYATARQNVSLVQLASSSRIGLFHLAAFPQKDKLVTPALKTLLEDPDITKLGVSIKADCRRVSQYLGVDVRGQFELSHLYKLVKYCKSGEHRRINKTLVSLANQVKEHLGLPLYKGSDVRESDWSKALNLQQVMYSASDAYAAVQLYAVLDHERKNLDPVPATPHHVELNLPIPLPNAVTAKATEEPEAESEAAAVKGGADGQAQPDPETEKAIGETLVREDESEPKAETSLEAAGKVATKTAITTRRKRTTTAAAVAKRTTKTATTAAVATTTTQTATTAAVVTTTQTTTAAAVTVTTTKTTTTSTVTPVPRPTP